MVAACIGVTEPSPATVALAARAEGNPFLVEELLAAAASAGALVHDGAEWSIAETVEPVVPLTFADGVRRRLGPLGGDTRRVLAAAAVIGRRFDWSILPSIAGATDDAVLEALRSGIAAQILTTEPASGSFLFRHALTRDVVLAELLPPERAELARRALAAVGGRHPGLPGQWCELAADLALAAGDRERSAGLLLEVGRRAFDAGALASAEVALDRALSRTRELRPCWRSTSCSSRWSPCRASAIGRSRSAHRSSLGWDEGARTRPAVPTSTSC